MPNLRIQEGGGESVHQIDDEVTTIGRGEGNTIPIRDGKASKEHCRIERAGARWKMIDLESKNGTRVNGAYKNKAWLDHGDTIAIGRAEIRFGVEGGRRDTAAAAAQGGAGAAALQPATWDGDDAAPPPPPPRGPSRYRRDAGRDKALMIGAFVVLGVIVLVIANNTANPLVEDDFNKLVIERSRELMEQDRWEDARQYVLDNADPERRYYEMVKEHIATLEDGVESHRRNRLNQEAHHLVSKIGRRIRSYHRGSESADPAEILKMFEQLKTTYAGTENAELVRRNWPAWWAGRVPERAADHVSSGDSLGAAWRETLDRAAPYEREWRFREAIETIERFLTTRSFNMDAQTLAAYETRRDQQIERIRLRASSIYYERERMAEGFLKNRLYKKARAEYQQVIDKFGLDEFVRKAKAALEKIDALEAEEG